MCLISVKSYSEWIEIFIGNINIIKYTCVYFLYSISHWKAVFNKNLSKQIAERGVLHADQ